MNTTEPITVRDLILLRLLQAGEKGITPKKLLDDLQSLAPSLSREGLEKEGGGLVGEGLLAARPRQGYRITAEGREKAKSAFHIKSRDVATARWQQLKEVFLVARCLDLPSPAGVREKKRFPDEVRLALLRQCLDLTVRRGATLGAAVDALLLREMKQPRAKGLKQAVIMRAVRRGESPAPVPVEPVPARMETKLFAEIVVAGARRTQTGWVGRKVFISHVWNQLRYEGLLRGDTLDSFKEQLVQANAAGLLALSRADLAPTLNQEDVATSQISYLNATFHFLTIDQERA